jgi:hypothetical protein
MSCVEADKLELTKQLIYYTTLAAGHADEVLILKHISLVNAHMNAITEDYNFENGMHNIRIMWHLDKIERLLCIM